MRSKATADRMMNKMSIRTYSKLMRLGAFKERYEYLKLNGTVGQETFGFDRYMNQQFYKSQEWKAVRDLVIIRDGGCDLGIEGCDILGKIYIHHMNPISQKDIQTRSDFLLNPEFLISTTLSTHNAIHYGDDNLLLQAPVERCRNDTCPWRR